MMAEFVSNSTIDRPLSVGVMTAQLSGDTKSLKSKHRNSFDRPVSVGIMREINEGSCDAVQKSVSVGVMVEKENSASNCSPKHRHSSKRKTAERENHSKIVQTRNPSSKRKSHGENPSKSATQRPLSIGVLTEIERSSNHPGEKGDKLLEQGDSEHSGHKLSARSTSRGDSTRTSGGLTNETRHLSNSSKLSSVSVTVMAELKPSCDPPTSRSKSVSVGTETVKDVSAKSSPSKSSTSTVNKTCPSDSDPLSVGDSLSTIDKVSFLEKEDETDSDIEEDPPFSDQYTCSDHGYYDSHSDGELSDTGTVVVGAEGTSLDDDDSHDPQKAGDWHRNIDYLFCCLGFVCGLSNITQFPCLAAKHGGATFCLAYSVVVFLCGVPLVYLETAIGQFSGHGPIKSWTIVPLFSGLGFAMVLVSVLISIYHSIYITWIIYYIGLTFSPGFISNNSSAINQHNRTDISTPYPDDMYIERPSVSHTNSYTLHKSHSGKLFHKEVLSLSEGAHTLGDVQPLLVACLVITWIIVFILLVHSTKGLPKVLYILLPLPTLLVISLLIKSCLIEGAVEGIRFYLTPKWSRLVNPELWFDVGRQVFVSLGLGTGALISLNSHSSFNSNCHRNSLVIVLGNAFSSVFTGILIFSLMGAISHKHNTSVEELISHDTDVSFLLVLEVLGPSPGAAVWAGMFFLLLCIVAISRQCFLVHNIVLSVKELFASPPGCSGQGGITLTGCTCFTLCLPTLALTTQGGLYLARLLDEYVCKWGLFFLCLCECVTAMWVYGGRNFLNCISQMSRRQDQLWWRIMWGGITPSTCLVMLMLTWWGHDGLTYGSYQYSTSGEVIGWCISCLPIGAITLGVLWRCGLSRGNFKQRLDLLTKTPADWGRGHCTKRESNLPEYIACSPEDHMQDPVIHPDVTSGLLWNMFALASVAEVKVPQIYQQGQDLDVGMVPSGGYLTDLVDVDGYSIDSDSTGDENKERGNWAGKLEFIMSGLGYVVGLGNVWRFPYLVYRNGGGAFFIAYLAMLIFCGIPLVFMELSFGQYASLGPISIWKAVPMLKGVGISMVIISGLVGIYYTMVVAWALLYLFSSMTQNLPWNSCHNTWNTIWCNADVLVPGNCTSNNTGLQNLHNRTSNESVFMQSRETTLNHIDPFCLNWTVDAANNSLAVLHKGLRYNNPSEEYFYLNILNISEDIGVFGEVQWKLALCLLLAWTLIFVCLVKGIKSSGKVMYLIVGIPYLSILILLIQNMTMDGFLDGVKYYVTPKWSSLSEARVWSDAATQIFFSLSACWGGLTTLSSYNRFKNNIYRDAIIICLGDTLMSVLAGFGVFSMIGVLGKQLNTTVENVIQSDVGLAFIAYPEAIARFPISPLWSILFFLMLSMMGMSTQMTNVETIVTAVIDENPALLKKRRALMLLVLCGVLYLCGLPLTTQGGIYWLQLMDEYLAGWSVMVLGIIMCLGLGYLYGIHKFCMNIKQMIGETPSWWWKIMWCVVSPLVILFILVFSLVDYEPGKFGSRVFPTWAQAFGFCLTILPLLPIPLYMAYKIIKQEGSFCQRVKASYLPDKDWGPALEKFWDVQYLPTINSVYHHPLHDLGISSIETVTDRVDFTTVGVRTGCLSESSLLTGSTNLNSPISRKHYDNIRQRAILQHAYSNPQSLYHSSSEKLPVSRQNSYNSNSEYIIVPRRKKRVEMFDKSTQTSRSSLATNSRSSLATNSHSSIATNSRSSLATTQSLKNVSGEVTIETVSDCKYPVEPKVEISRL